MFLLLEQHGDANNLSNAMNFELYKEAISFSHMHEKSSGAVYSDI